MNRAQNEHRYSILRRVALLILLILAIGFISSDSAHAETATLKHVKTAKELVQFAKDTESGIVILDDDIKLTEESGGVRIPAENHITLDLNGHVIYSEKVNRGQSYEPERNILLYVIGQLTVKDSRPDTKHTGRASMLKWYIWDPTTEGSEDSVSFTGGGIAGSVDAIFLDSGGAPSKVTMNGGTIFGSYKGINAVGLWSIVDDYKDEMIVSINEGTSFIKCDMAVRTTSGNLYMDGGEEHGILFDGNCHPINAMGAVAEIKGIHLTNSDYTRSLSRAAENGVINLDTSEGGLIEDCIVENNLGNDLDTVYIGREGSTIKDCIFRGNNNADETGTLYIDADNTTVKNCVFENNEANLDNTKITSYSRGGAIYVNSSNNTIENCTLTGNRAFDGSAIYLAQDNNLLKDLTIADNNAKGCGAVYVDDSDNVLEDVTVTGNSSRLEDGAGVYIDDENTTLKGNCQIRDNTGLNYERYEVKSNLFEVSDNLNVKELSLESKIGIRHAGSYENVDDHYRVEYNKSGMTPNVFTSDVDGWSVQTDDGYLCIENRYRITYDRNGGQGTEVVTPVIPNSTVTVEDCNYTKWGKHFKEWNTKADGSGTSYQPGDSITLQQNLTLYAIWGEAYTITFNSNLGTGYMAPQAFLKDGSTAIATLPACAYTMQGKAFTGWSTTGDGSGQRYQVGDQIELTKDTILYATWDQDALDYALVFQSDGTVNRDASLHEIDKTNKDEYEVSKEQLKEWGIEWDGYELKLTNVNFQTTSDFGFIVVTAKTDSYKVVLKGKNTINVMGAVGDSKYHNSNEAGMDMKSGFWSIQDVEFVGSSSEDTLSVVAPKVPHGIFVMERTYTYLMENRRMAVRNCTVQAAAGESGIQADSYLAAAGATVTGSTKVMKDFSGLAPAKLDSYRNDIAVKVNGEVAKTGKIVAADNTYYMYFNKDKTVTWKDNEGTSHGAVDPTEAKEKYGISWMFNSDGTDCTVTLKNANFQTACKYALYFDGLTRSVIEADGDQNLIAARGTEETDGAAIYCDDGVLRFNSPGKLTALAPNQQYAIYNDGTDIQLWKGILNASNGGDGGAVRADEHIYYMTGEESGKLLDVADVKAGSLYTEDFSTVSGTAYLNNSDWDPAISTDVSTNYPAKAVTIQFPDLWYMGNGGVDANGMKGDVKFYSMNDSITLAENTFTRENCSFKEWNTKSDGSGTSYQPGDTLKITGHTTLYAIWERDTTSIHFDANTGASELAGSMDDQIINSGESAALTTNAFARNGYTFQHWNTKPDGSGETFRDGQQIDAEGNKSMTLYAIWEVNKYSIDFDANGGQGNMADIHTSYDADAELPANTFTREDYEFIGWNTKPDGTGTIFADKSNVSRLAELNGQTIKMYAQWQQEANADLTAISLLKNGEQLEEGDTIKVGDEVTIVASTREYRQDATLSVSIAVDDEFYDAHYDNTYKGYVYTTSTLPAGEHSTLANFAYSYGEETDVVVTKTLSFTVSSEDIGGGNDPDPDQGTYYINSGDGASEAVTALQPLTFSFKREKNDEETFDHFTGILIDGNAVAETDSDGSVNYTKRRGSVIVELQTSLLQRLGAGQHTITAQFNDGNDVTGTFTLTAAQPSGSSDQSGQVAPGKTGSADQANSGNAKASAGSKKSAGAKTGDETPFTAMAVVLLGAVTALGGLTYKKRK